MGTRAPLPQTPVRTAVDWRVWAPCGSRSDPVLDKQTAKSIFWQQWDKIEHRRILNSTKELLRILLFVKTVSWSCFKMSLCMRWCNCRSGYRWNERMLRVAWKVLKQEGWGHKGEIAAAEWWQSWTVGKSGSSYCPLLTHVDEQLHYNKAVTKVNAVTGSGPEREEFCSKVRFSPVSHPSVARVPLFPHVGW